LLLFFKKEALPLLPPIIAALTPHMISPTSTGGVEVANDQSGINMGVVIIGGGQAASEAAMQLRQAKFPGAITIISDEAHLPYARPPLSKDYLAGEVDPAVLADESSPLKLLIGRAAA
jgi:lysine/ornithine N-monooxygenase